MNTQKRAAALIIHPNAALLETLKEEVDHYHVLTGQDRNKAFWGLFNRHAAVIEAIVFLHHPTNFCMKEFVEQIRKEKDFTGRLIAITDDPSLQKLLDHRKNDIAITDSSRIPLLLKTAMDWHEVHRELVA